MHPMSNCNAGNGNRRYCTLIGHVAVAVGVAAAVTVALVAHIWRDLVIEILDAA